MRPDTVPDKLESNINYKIIFAIIAAAVFLQISLYFLENEEQRNEIVYSISITSPLATSLTGFIIAKRYGSSKTFSKSYFALGCGYLCTTIGEILYFVYEEILRIEPYPSLADVFFAALYPLILIHLIINVRFFKPKISLIEFLWMAAITIGITSTYIITSYSQIQEANFDFYYGILFTIETAVILPFAILGAKTFKSGLIGNAWLILVFAIIGFAIGDVWYYYLEVFDEYDLLHPVNLFWYAGYWIVIYALYKHKKSI
ncbi:MAG: histidine kinase [Thermoproteota archaeon]